MAKKKEGSSQSAPAVSNGKDNLKNSSGFMTVTIQDLSALAVITSVKITITKSDPSAPQPVSRMATETYQVEKKIQFTDLSGGEYTAAGEVFGTQGNSLGSVKQDKIIINDGFETSVNLELTKTPDKNVLVMTNTNPTPSSPSLPSPPAPGPTPGAAALTWDLAFSCGPPVQRAPDSCPNNDEVDVVDAAAKSCATLSIKSGDGCEKKGETCVASWAKTCKSGIFKHPQGTTSNTMQEAPKQQVVLTCVNKQEEMTKSATTMCPVSRAYAKKGISYLTGAQQFELSQKVLGLKLATYEYKPEYSSIPGPQLGFIIDDQPRSSILTSDGGRVNLYSYISAVVATLQEQKKEIETLKKELNSLKSKKSGIPPSKP